MNIFTSDISPIISAQNLDDKRVVKMCLESAQIICTIAHKHKINAPYKPTHKNHPAVLWAVRSIMGFNWLVHHFHALCSEYEHRFDNTHKCSYDINYDLIEEIFTDIVDSYHPEWCENDTLLSFIDYPSSAGGSIEACRQILIDKWKNDKLPPKWSYRNPPEWYRRTVK